MEYKYLFFIATIFFALLIPRRDTSVTPIVAEKEKDVIVNDTLVSMCCQDSTLVKLRKQNDSSLQRLKKRVNEIKKITNEQ